MKKQPYNKHNKGAEKKQQTKQTLKRLLSPKKILAQEAANNKTEDPRDSVAQPVTNQSMENSENNDSGSVPEVKEPVIEVKEPAKTVDLNLEDSGFFEPVIQREYAETPQSQVVEPVKVKEPVIEPEKPKIIFAPRMTIKTDDTYKKVMGDDVPEGADQSNPVSPTDQIPGMQFQEAATTSFDLSDNADSLGRQVGQEAGNTTSEWAFGMLENFYPEVVGFFTKIPTDWVEKAKLPNALEAEMLGKILAANAKNKNKVRISDFHKKNILPPLKRILEKKGWENVMPDELLLVIGLVVLAADSFFKIQEIKKSNKVLEKELKQKMQEYIDIRTAERKEIDELKGQLGEMASFMKQFQTMQQAAAAAA